MVKVLKEYFWQVQSTDAHQYGYAQQRDFLTHPYETNAVDWVITNPQFRLAEEFVLRALRLARHGVAILARTVFLESVGRYGGVSPPANASATIRDAKHLGVGRERAQSAEEADDLQSAESLYRRVMKLDPNDPAPGLARWRRKLPIGGP